MTRRRFPKTPVDHPWPRKDGLPKRTGDMTLAERDYLLHQAGARYALEHPTDDSDTPELAAR